MTFLPGSQISAPERRRSRQMLLLVMVLASLGVAVLVLIPPANSKIYAPCPWLFVTGTFCPGCGSLRGISAMAHGDPLGLWRHNPFAFIALPFLTYSLASMASRALAGYALPGVIVGRRTLLTLAGLIIVYGVVRNLIPALAPQPL